MYWVYLSVVNIAVTLHRLQRYEEYTLKFEYLKANIIVTLFISDNYYCNL